MVKCEIGYADSDLLVHHDVVYTCLTQRMTVYNPKQRVVEDWSMSTSLVVVFISNKI